jgi:hypothetical protein
VATITSLAPHLARRLGLFDTTMIVHNSLIGLGIMLTGLPAYLFWRIAKNAKEECSFPIPFLSRV